MRMITACFVQALQWHTSRVFARFLLILSYVRRIDKICNLLNVTAHPTASWTLQQLREALPADHRYRFLIHERDSIFSAQLDRSIQHLGVRVLKTPPQSPQANAFCERLLGTLRRGSGG